MTLPASTMQAGAPPADRSDAPASLTTAPGTLPAPSRRWGTGGIIGFVLPFALALVWEASVRLGFSNGRLMPPPSRIGATLWDLAQTGELASHAAATLWRVAAGFGLGAAAGTVLGAVSGASPMMRRIMDPTLQALRAIPSIAWVPLFILWLGIFEASKVALIAVGVFFPVYLGVAAALSGVDRKIIEVGRVFRLSRLQMIRRVTLPAILPAWITALRTGLGLGFMFVVAAEFMGASEGLGYLLVDGQQLGRPDRILAAIIAFAVLGKLADGLLVVVTRPLLTWQDVGRDRL
ncbi:MAG: ABC transporter permease [Bosea sp. (in: a-proteobacteria)]|jgi:sulfonate transport system permease protein